jgi:hypothetical protein
VKAPVAWAAKSCRSLPAVKASPSAWNTTTRTAGSVSARSRLSASTPYMALLRAFFFSGRDRVMVITPASMATLT